MEHATFLPRWKQPPICRCHKLHGSIYDLPYSVMHFSIIFLYTLMSALENFARIFRLPIVACLVLPD